MFLEFYFLIFFGKIIISSVMLVKSLKRFIIKKFGMFLIKLQHFEFFFLENIILGIFRQIPNFEDRI